MAKVHVQWKETATFEADVEIPDDAEDQEAEILAKIEASGEGQTDLESIETVDSSIEIVEITTSEDDPLNEAGGDPEKE